MFLRMLIFGGVILCCSPFAGGRVFSWSKTPESIASGRAEGGGIPDLWQSAEVSAIIEKAAQLDAYRATRKPDCFQRVASALRVHCEQLEMNEEERIRAATSMTLCELATANHWPPLECAPLAVDDPSSGHPSRSSLDSCVGALSRSAQYWSSYSGYLREAPQLCYAYRRWHDIDTAKETYRNATSDVLLLLQAIRAQADDNLRRQDRLDGVLQRVQASLADMSAMQNTLSRASSVLHQSVTSLSTEAMTVFRDMLVELQESHTLAGRLAAEELSLNLDMAVEKHAAALTALVPSLKRDFETEIAIAFAGAAAQYQTLQEQAESTMAGWKSLGNDVQGLQQSIERLLVTSSEATSQLAIHVSQAAVAQRVQQDATHSAARLALVLVELTNSTRNELSAINATATAVREELTNTGRYHASIWDAQWVREWADYSLMWLLQVAFNGNRTNIDILSQLPIVRVGCFCLQAFWYLLRVGFSTVAEMALDKYTSSSDLSRRQGTVPPQSGTT